MSRSEMVPTICPVEESTPTTALASSITARRTSVCGAPAGTERTMGRTAAWTTGAGT